MSIEIWMTKAGIGDCILIRCGKQKKKVNILIDSGQGAGSFDTVLRKIVRNDEKIDLLILTHDDNDHVKGACNLLERVIRTDKGIGNEDTHTSHTKIRHTTRNYATLGIWKRFFQFSGSLLIKRDTSSAIWHSDAL